MQKNDVGILPMHAFFESLIENQFHLGIGEYQSFLNALQYGFGVSEQRGVFLKDKLLRLCKLLWLKPNQSTQLFEELFEAAYSFEAQVSEETIEMENKSMSEALQDDSSDTGKNGKPLDENTEMPIIEMPKEDTQKQNTLVEQKISNQSVFVQVAMGQNEKGRDLNMSSDQKVDLEKSKFLLSSYYLPINQRKTQQNLRVFPKFRYAEHSQEIDIEATINKTIENGQFTEGVFQKAKNNTAQLLLLIDHDGSMIAFHVMADFLKTQIEKALNSNMDTKNKNTINVFYFYNVPRKRFFKNTAHTKGESKEKLINSLKGKDISVLIFSDAGAARGKYSQNRVDETHEFLSDLYKCTHKIAWLNPMPKKRWADTSAEDIAQQVAMYEADENGIKNAILQLKGRINTTITRI